MKVQRTLKTSERLSPNDNDHEGLAMHDNRLDIPTYIYEHEFTHIHRINTETCP